MGKFDIQVIRFLTSQHFRILTSIEMGMKNHELVYFLTRKNFLKFKFQVPLPLIASIAAIHRGATSRLLNDLTRSKLVVYERSKRCWFLIFNIFLGWETNFFQELDNKNSWGNVQ